MIRISPRRVNLFSCSSSLFWCWSCYSYSSDCSGGPVGGVAASTAASCGCSSSAAAAAAAVVSV